MRILYKRLIGLFRSIFLTLDGITEGKEEFIGATTKGRWFFQNVDSSKASLAWNQLGWKQFGHNIFRHGNCTLNFHSKEELSQLFGHLD